MNTANRIDYKEAFESAQAECITLRGAVARMEEINNETLNRCEDFERERYRLEAALRALCAAYSGGIADQKAINPTFLQYKYTAAERQIGDALMAGARRTNITMKRG